LALIINHAQLYFVRAKYGMSLRTHISHTVLVGGRITFCSKHPDCLFNLLATGLRTGWRMLSVGEFTVTQFHLVCQGNCDLTCTGVILSRERLSAMTCYGARS
jgi:hypothetical protein